MMYLVTYTLYPKRDVTRVITALQQSPEWMHYLDDTWLVVTNESADQLYKRLVPSFLDTDRILIIQVTQFADFQAWLPKAALDWFRERRFR